MSTRWRRNASYGELAKIHHDIADAREAIELERALSVVDAREQTRMMLGSHGLFMASHALRDPTCQTYIEFRTMSDRMRRGGYHECRWRNGGSLDV